MKINTLLAKSISYDASKTRDLKDIKYIVIHYTGNKGDTAENNCIYYNAANTRQAGAHFYVDKKPEVWKSVNMNRTAWAVGGDQRSGDGGGKYYGKCTNANSVSVELCDCCQSASFAQMRLARKLVRYIQKKCPNAKTVIRHWDVNGKQCPAPMVGQSNEKWERLHSYLTDGYQYKVKVTSPAWLRSSAKIAPGNKLSKAKKGDVFKIVKTKKKWGRIQGRTSAGKFRWINLKKCKEI